jgi:hypothetical protein
MNIVGRRVVVFAARALLVSIVSACGDNEADQRKTFVDFLQTQIVNVLP